MNPRCQRVSAWRALHAALWLTVAMPAGAEELADRPQEFHLKAAFIYNFSQFIEWPAAAFDRPDTAFSICVMGKDPFGESLLAVQKRTYHARPIAVKHPQNIAEARRCQILYVDEPSQTPPGRDLVKALGGAPVLTISSNDKAAESGVAIAFLLQAGRVRWIMNLDATRRAQLKVSAKLIEIAVEVIGESR